MSADSREIKEIVVIQGDEYRAKTSGSFSKRIFFSDVYVKANRLVNEIMKASNDYLDLYKDESRYEHQLRGVGNNIIIFTGWRGQGKTSAMQTFAYYLKGLIRDDNDALLGENGCYKEGKFEVLGTIDPTMMNRNESIVKVLLSRLFIAFDKKLNGEAQRYGSREREEQKRDILRLFSQCFDNVNYFGNEEKSIYSGNDLDSLARLGSSTELRCNLHKLISKYLNYGKTESVGSRFLIIQIDDADLSTANTYETCEQIREYLTIPNVIVLMATDFRQIRNSVYQAYITEYRDVLKLQSRVDMVDNCFQKTMKYLEKMFPQGHRISLPELKDDECLNFDYLQLVYKEKITDENNLVVFSGCDTIKDQLLRLMFERTGVVFRKSRQGMHPFLPETLRELTHLLRIFFEDMKEIDQVTLYKYLFTKDEDKINDVNRQLEMQNANLDQLYRYFWDNWAYVRLGKKPFEILRKIVKFNSDVERAKVFIIEKYLAELKEKDYEKQFEECRKDIDDKLDRSKTITKILEYAQKLDFRDGYGNLKASLGIFYTIRLNQWFNEDLRNRKLDRFEGFENMPFQIPANNGYFYTDFQLDHPDELIEQRVTSNLIATKENNPETDMTFSAWNLMTSRVRAINDAVKRDALGLDREDFMDTRSQEDPETVKKKQELHERADWSLVLNVKVIVANIDVIEFIKYWTIRYLNSGSKKTKSILKTDEWEETVKHMLRIFSEWRSESGEDKSKPFEYLSTVEIFKNTDKDIEKYTERMGELFKFVFLNNDSNRKLFTKEYKETVNSYCDEIKKKLGDIRAKSGGEISAKQAAEELIGLDNSSKYAIFNMDFSNAGGTDLQDLYGKKEKIHQYILSQSEESKIMFKTFNSRLSNLLG